MCAVIGGLYVDYSSDAVEHVLHYGKHILSGAYDKNMKCKCTRASGHTVDYIELIYAYIVVSYLYMN